MGDLFVALCFFGALYFLGMAIFVWGPEEQKKQLREELRQEQIVTQ